MISALHPELTSDSVFCNLFYYLLNFIKKRADIMKCGYHAVYEYSFEEAIDFACVNGFDFVQFDLGVPTFFLDRRTDRELAALHSLAQSRHVEITFHGPCDNVSLFCDYPQISRGILDQYTSILYKANLLGARHLTIHTGKHPQFKITGSFEDEYIKRFGRHYGDTLRENILSLLEKCGETMLCIENDGFTPLVMDTVGDMLGKYDNLYLTCDIPKLYTKKLILNKDVYDFMDRNKAFIREAHLHDCSKTYGRHQMIGKGKIDFSKFKDFFMQENVYWNFEIRPREAALHSMKEFIKEYSFTD